MKTIISSSIGERERNEDRYIIKRNKDDNWEFYGVFDGHRSSLAADFASKFIYKNFEFKIRNIDWKEDKDVLDLKIKCIFESIFLKCQLEMILKSDKYDFDKSGTTACCVFIKDKMMWVANAGDSRAVLCTLDFNSLGITEDHNYNNLNERARTVIQGGWYENRYLYGKVNTTRGLGDLWQLRRHLGDDVGKLPHHKTWSSKGYDTREKIEDLLKKIDYSWHISPYPEVYSIDNVDENLFLFLATDGVWSVIDTEDLIEGINEGIMIRNIEDREGIEELVKELVENRWKELGKGSDNVTFIMKYFTSIFWRQKRDDLESKVEKDEKELNEIQLQN